MYFTWQYDVNVVDADLMHCMHYKELKSVKEKKKVAEYKIDRVKKFRS